jgi:hypothetical protein
MANPFRIDGEWLKSQFHAHSLRSDGDAAPEDVAAAYRRHGFDVLTISDHWTMTKIDAPDGLLLVPGAELMVDPVDGPMCPEFLAIGIDDVPEEPSGDRANWYRYEHSVIKTFASFDDGIAYVEGFGGATVLCHPAWSGLPQPTIFAASGMHGVEVWNASAHRENDRGDSTYVWDLILDENVAFAPFATDDSHYADTDVADAWTMVRAPDRTREAVVAALRAGNVYGSNGPTILDIERDGNAVEVAVSPVRDIWLHGSWEDGVGLSAGERGRSENGSILERDDDGLLTRVRFEPQDDVWRAKRSNRWWRIVTQDVTGRRAWSNVV